MITGTTCPYLCCVHLLHAYPHLNVPVTALAMCCFNRCWWNTSELNLLVCAAMGMDILFGSSIPVSLTSPVHPAGLGEMFARAACFLQLTIRRLNIIGNCLWSLRVNMDTNGKCWSLSTPSTTPQVHLLIAPTLDINTWHQHPWHQHSTSTPTDIDTWQQHPLTATLDSNTQWCQHPPTPTSKDSSTGSLSLLITTTQLYNSCGSRVSPICPVAHEWVQFAQWLMSPICTVVYEWVQFAQWLMSPICTVVYEWVQSLHSGLWVQYAQWFMSESSLCTVV